MFKSKFFKRFMPAAVLFIIVLALPITSAIAKDKTHKWVGQAFCGRSLSIFESIDHLGYLIDKYTDGKLKVECKQADELVPAGQVFDAASQGIIDFGHGCPCLARSKAYGAQLYCDAPGGQSPIEEVIWYYNAGGKELLEEIFEKKYNAHPIACAIYTAEVWLFSNKEIKTIEDLKGLKLRSAGFRGEILQSMGASVVVLPGGEIVPSMERGVIDAMEYGNLHITYDVGFNDVTKYLYYHPTKATSTLNFWAVNLQKWNELSDDLKKAVEKASKDAVFHSLTWHQEQDLLAMKKAVEIKKNEVRLLPEAVTREFDEISADYYYKKAKEDEYTRRILESWAKFKKDYGDYAKWLDYFNMTGDHFGLQKGDS
ncbi:TRAP transporter substrate-binding protein [Desulfotignum balticum]|uniref:TRAP transporter substrate-binding protein n=1 Tax=Desulfotignum balticum TaxID=115781 RepID=UPI000462A632|nr:TRAP transporter substrate-binding protein DctP [Desulfotignum balticum]